MSNPIDRPRSVQDAIASFERKLQAEASPLPVSPGPAGRCPRQSPAKRPSSPSKVTLRLMEMYYFDDVSIPALPFEEHDGGGQ